MDGEWGLSMPRCILDKKTVSVVEYLKNLLKKPDRIVRLAMGLDQSSNT